MWEGMEHGAEGMGQIVDVEYNNSIEEFGFSLVKWD
jgi:hypothetical protein